MLVAAFTVIIFFCLPRNLHAAGLAEPGNVTMVTLNTNYTLRWDWDQSWRQDVTFTVEYVGNHHFRPKKKPAEVRWNLVCANLSRRSCDLSEAQLLYLGKYVVRVRADAGGTHSEWVMLKFHPDEHAKVGPPSRVTLSCTGSDVDVHIDDPVAGSSNASMRTHLPSLYYYILYWEGPSLSQSSHVQNLSSKANLVTLPELKGGTSYCVAVQTRNNKYPKESSFTSPLCIRTDGVTLWWVIFLCFLSSMVLCFLLVFCLYKTCRSLKAVFFPASQLPSHFREYLYDSPGSDKPRLLTSEAEQLCDKLVVCPRAFPEEQPPPPEDAAAADSSHQGGSRDSGVYSSDSDSSASQPSSQQTSRGSDLFWTDLCPPDQLKKHVRAAELPLGDEGVSDLCI